MRLHKRTINIGFIVFDIWAIEVFDGSKNPPQNPPKSIAKTVIKFPITKEKFN
jgi:hypothetical protein